MRPPQTVLLATLAAALRAWDTASLLEAAFVYGSVATGSAGPASDIDLFVITAAPPAPDALVDLKERAASLQSELGYCPDPDYPVEVFAAGECERLLAGPVLGEAFAAAARGPVAAAVIDADALEVARALTGPGLEVIAAPVADRLRDLARAALAAAWEPVAAHARAAVSARLRVPAPP